jgi:hypothetical protein
MENKEDELIEIEKQILQITSNSYKTKLKRFEKNKLKELRKKYDLIKKLKVEKEEEEKRKKKEEELRKKNYEKRKLEIKRISKKVTSEFNSILKASESIEKQTTETIKNMIEMGDIIKDEILIEKKENPEKFVNVEEEIKNEKSDNFAISLLAKTLENNGITTAVEKETEDKDIAAANLQFMINGLASKKN